MKYIPLRASKSKINITKKEEETKKERKERKKERNRYPTLGQDVT